MRRTDFSLRSLLFVPAHDSAMIQKAVKTETDAIILDLEDAVPADQKEEARRTITKMAEHGLFDDVVTFCRTNALDTEYIFADLMDVASGAIDGFLCPKITNESDVRIFISLLEQIEIQLCIEREFAIVPLIETPGAVMNVQEICAISERVIAVAFGSEDFVADLESTKDSGQSSLFVPRALIAMGARAEGAVPVDTVYIDVSDGEGFAESVRLAHSLGYEGALILHPNQIPIANQEFTPSDDDIETAENILYQMGEIKAKNRGVGKVEQTFIGPPIMKAARKTLERADRLPDRD